MQLIMLPLLSFPQVGSQTSLQSWASSLSYDSQAEDFNEPKEFMRKFVEEVFKMPHVINIDRKARFGELAQARHSHCFIFIIILVDS